MTPPPSEPPAVQDVTSAAEASSAPRASDRPQDETTTSADDPLALERQVCFALAIATRSVLAVYRPLLEPMGLTHPQYLVMLALWGRSPLAVKEIGTLLQLDSPTLSPLLKRLAAADLITRSRSRDDERVVLIGLTGAGRQLRNRAEQIPPAVVAQLGIDLSELEALHGSLTRLIAAARTGAAGLPPFEAGQEDEGPRGQGPGGPETMPSHLSSVRSNRTR